MSLIVGIILIGVALVVLSFQSAPSLSTTSFNYQFPNIGSSSDSVPIECTNIGETRLSGERKVALVTGAAGFIGSMVAQYCASVLGMKVIAIDSMTNGFAVNIPKGVTFLAGDVTDSFFLETVFKTYTFDFVYHLAGTSNENLSHFARSFNYRNNLVASVELLNQAVKHNVTSFVFASSISVYGTNKKFIDEQSEPAPESPYAISKYAFELDLKAAHETWGIDYVIFRLHNVYGPNQNVYASYHSTDVAKYIRQIMEGKPIEIAGNGKQTKMLSYIEDIVPLIAQGPLVPSARNEDFNIGGLTRYSAKELAKQVSLAMGLSLQIAYNEAIEELDDPKVSKRKISCVFPDLEPTELRVGLQKTAHWLRDNGLDLTKVKIEAVEVKKNIPVSVSNSALKEIPFLPQKGNLIVNYSKEMIEFKKRFQMTYSKKAKSWLPRTSVSVRTYDTLVALLMGINSNRKDYSLASITSLSTISDEFDLIAIDGSPSKEKSIFNQLGTDLVNLTQHSNATFLDAWIYAYDTFIKRGYKHLIVVSENVLIPNGTISRLVEALEQGYSVACPFATNSNVEEIYRLENIFGAQFKSNFFNFGKFQSTLEESNSVEGFVPIEDIKTFCPSMFALDKKLQDISKTGAKLFTAINASTPLEIGNVLIKRMSESRKKCKAGVRFDATVFHMPEEPLISVKEELKTEKPPPAAIQNDDFDDDLEVEGQEQAEDDI